MLIFLTHYGNQEPILINTSLLVSAERDIDKSTKLCFNGNVIHVLESLEEIVDLLEGLGTAI